MSPLGTVPRVGGRPHGRRHHRLPEMGREGGRAIRTELALTALILGSAALAADFAVNTTLDGADVLPGDGVCETSAGSGTCSLRAAIQEANAFAGADRIDLPAGTYGAAGPR